MDTRKSLGMVFRCISMDLGRTLTFNINFRPPPPSEGPPSLARGSRATHRSMACRATAVTDTTTVLDRVQVGWALALIHAHLYVRVKDRLKDPQTMAQTGTRRAIVGGDSPATVPTTVP